VVADWFMWELRVRVCAVLQFSLDLSAVARFKAQQVFKEGLRKHKEVGHGSCGCPWHASV
jgi:hypothetical protein